MASGTVDPSLTVKEFNGGDTMPAAKGFAVILLRISCANLSGRQPRTPVSPEYVFISWDGLIPTKDKHVLPHFHVFGKVFYGVFEKKLFTKAQFAGGPLRRAQ
jgi:hypothetical protein